MGIIKRQAIQSTTFIYLGVIVGFLNSALLLPALFSSEQVGLIGFLNSLTLIFSTIGALGIPLITVKMFPAFRDRNQRDHGFFSLSFWGSIAGITIGLLTFFLLKDLLISDNNAANDYYLFPFAFCIIFAFRVLFRVSDSYLRMLYKTVLGITIESFVVKVVILLGLVTVWYYPNLDFSVILVVYIIALSMPGTVTTLYLLTNKVSINGKKFIKHLGPNRKSIVSFGFFGILGGMGTMIVLEVDRLMISNMIDLSANGIYSVAFFFGLFISIPSRGLKRIALSILSDAMEKKDMKTVGEIYTKSCVNQLLIGGYLFLGIWLCVEYVFDFMRPEYATGLYVVLFVALAQLIDMATGVNAEIIGVSKHYRYNSYFTAILIVLAIGLNFILIPIWGISGAAFASFLSMLIINLLRFLFLYKRMQLTPFNMKMLLNVILIVGLFFGFEFVFPKFENPILGILITGTTLTIIYFLIAYKLQISTDINQMANRLLKRIIP
ncbi:MAG: O-antigen/teichoic acid export membrane protein [Salibacteraceae bacterium]|jgi:O-antigen/teichoic acid export membrane protein